MAKNQIVERLPAANIEAGPKRIGLIGVHPHRQCNAGAFTRDLRAALFDLPADIDCYTVLAGSPDASAGLGSLLLKQGDAAAYGRALNYLNFSDVEVVSLQYDVATFAADADRLLDLLETLGAPVVTTLHGMPLDPTPDEERTIKALGTLSEKMVVMASKGAEMLQDIYGVPASKAAVLPCGVPERPSLPAAVAKARLDAGGRTVLMTIGLLAPDKGIEVMIEALREIVPAHPDALYLVVGETHPALLAREGQRYRESLIELAKHIGVEKHVRFIDRHAQGRELCDMLAAADIYVSPYLSEAEVASHTLATAVGLGKAVVATPFWFATELLADDKGAIVPFGNPGRTAEAVNALLGEPKRLSAMRRRALACGRKMLWPQVAKAYYRLFAEAVERTRTPTPTSAVRFLRERSLAAAANAVAQLAS